MVDSLGQPASGAARKKESRREAAGKEASDDGDGKTEGGGGFNWLAFDAFNGSRYVVFKSDGWPV
jgi:hypothetical protein